MAWDLATPSVKISPMADAHDTSAEQDWRLEAELAGPEVGRSLSGLIARLRGGDRLVEEIETAVRPEAVITHDGRTLFAYADTRTALMDAREAIESALRSAGIQASIRVSHWDEQHERWRQTDPPPSAEQARADALLEHEQDTVDTRTLVATAGRLVRAEFEQTMAEWAAKQGLECKITEHPHLLSTQVGFTVTGPRGKIDEFSKGLEAEGWAMVRTETSVMASPL